MTQTPLLLKYRLKLRETPVSESHPFNGTGGWGSGGFESKDMEFYGETTTARGDTSYEYWNFGKLTEILEYYLYGWSGITDNFCDIMFPAKSFLIRKNRIDYVFDIETGSQIIGKVRMPLCIVQETKGNMMHAHPFNRPGNYWAGSDEEVYKHLSDYERQKTDQVKITLPFNSNMLAYPDIFVKIDDSGNLISPIQFEKIFANGKVEKVVMNKDCWEMFNDDGRFEKFEVRGI